MTSRSLRHSTTVPWGPMQSSARDRASLSMCQGSSRSIRGSGSTGCHAVAGSSGAESAQSSRQGRRRSLRWDQRVLDLYPTRAGRLDVCRDKYSKFLANPLGCGNTKANECGGAGTGTPRPNSFASPGPYGPLGVAAHSRATRRAGGDWLGQRLHGCRRRGSRAANRKRNPRTLTLQHRRKCC